MNRTNRNVIFALGLVTSFVLPGLALADNWNTPSLKYSMHQHQLQPRDAYRGQDRYRVREYAHRDGYADHEWYEHHRRPHRFDRDDDDGYHEWREHAQRYYRLHRYYSYGAYPWGYASGIYVIPAPRLVIDLH